MSIMTAQPGAVAPDLLVIDRLSVGPPRLEPRRLSVPYEVVRDGAVERFELLYRYEEDVFDPRQVQDHNLAALIGAQVALNYGLFCREIVFFGRFDRADRELLAAMAENTAREIYVNKLCADNPFLIDAARQRQPQARESYLAAELAFPDAEAAPAPAWPTVAQRHVVLASGGKDSLLSFGLLRELGTDVDSVFVNESGRHWFTALNAYRALRAIHPRTARVWTNADRLFAWMLRHLPFVRTDFQRVRSDIYPIRLWTVAVFLFGVLPLLRERRVDRLVIGDEHDTSRLRNDHGIEHYDGLYDQSLWFDHAITDYFERKGWNVRVLSLLRPLSELLIEKILAERYPDLLTEQVSCHAAHHAGGRMRPCGACEKCRRIGTMLFALGLDASACGYTPEQVEHGLAVFEREGIHQEEDDVAGLRVLLAARRNGTVPREPLWPLLVKLGPRSPLDELPEDLRHDLLRIWRQHAQGVVHWDGEVWQPRSPGNEDRP